MPVQYMRKKYRVGMDYKKQKSSSNNQGKKQNKVTNKNNRVVPPPMMFMNGKTGHCWFVPAEEST